MKHSNRFHSLRWFSLAVVLLASSSAITLQAQEDMWVLPGPDTWIGRGLIGSPTDPSLVPVQFQGEILFVPPGEVAGYIQKGGKSGWPCVYVPLLVDGKPVAVPIWLVTDVLRKGAETSSELVIMHKGNEHIAVRKSQVAEYTAKGYELGARPECIEGAVMCWKERLVVAASRAVAKYTKQGAEAGPCKK